MKVRWLGWAGVEIEAEGASLVIDPLEDPGATFAALGDGAREVQLPRVGRARGSRTAVGGMVSHLHRDHADAGALAAALAPEAIVHEPAWPGGAAAENLALAQANAELERLGRQPPAGGAMGARGGRAVHDHGAAGGRRPRRPAGLVARRGGRAARPAPRGHDLPRLLVADGPPPRALRPGIRTGQRPGDRLPAPAAAQRARRCDGARAGRARGRPTGGAGRRADALRRLRDRPVVSTDRRRGEQVPGSSSGPLLRGPRAEPR